MSKAKGQIRIVSHSEAPQDVFHNEDGSLTVKGLTALKIALYSPSEHNTVDLGITAFKRFLKGMPKLSKSQRNAQIREYKLRARRDYEELIKFKGSFPTMPVSA